MVHILMDPICKQHDMQASTITLLSHLHIDYPFYYDVANYFTMTSLTILLSRHYLSYHDVANPSTIIPLTPSTITSLTSLL